MIYEIATGNLNHQQILMDSNKMLSEEVFRELLTVPYNVATNEVLLYIYEGVNINLEQFLYAVKNYSKTLQDMIRHTKLKIDEKTGSLSHNSVGQDIYRYVIEK